MKKLRIALTFSTVATILACESHMSSGGNSMLISSSLDSPFLSSYPSGNNNLRISLTDAPSKDLKNVFINVDHAELFVRKGSGEGRLIVAQDLGLIDLMTLRNGVLLPLEDLSLPAGLEITAIRLVLKADNNHSIKADDSRCEMQTPSGQQSGIKIHLSQPFVLEQGQAYSMVMDFDAAKSVVVKGNGGCLLKPVLKLLSVTKSSGDAGEDASSTDASGETPVTDGADTNISTETTSDSTSDSSGSTGFEVPPADGSTTEPPVMTVQDTFNLA